MLLTYSDLKAQGEQNVMAHRIPASMLSKVLDYERPDKESWKQVSTSLPISADDRQTNAHISEERVTHEQEAWTFKGPLDYPAIVAWLLACENDLECGCDKHGYTVHLPVFEQNGCTRIDDIP